MAKTTYRDLVAWQRAMDLCCESYKLTSSFPRREQFGLTSQLRRTAISVPSNIAEGSGRASRKELLYHLSVARGSLKELETQLELGVRLGYVTREQTAAAVELCDHVSRLLYGLRRKLEG